MRTFLAYKKIDTGLLFEQTITAASVNPLDLAKELAGEEVGTMSFDFREKIKLETKTFVFEEDGFHKENQNV